MSDLLFSLTGNDSDDSGGGEDGKRKMTGLATGIVKDLNDPLCLGRVQVALDDIDEDDPLPWARVAVPMADNQAGHYWIPREGARVLLGFEGGDIDSPYVLGSLWDMKKRPPQQSPTPEVFGWRSPNGNQIVFTEKPGSITLQTSPTSANPMPSAASATASYQTLTLTQSGIQLLSKSKVELKVGANAITMDTSGITLKFGNSSLVLNASGLTLNGNRVAIKGSSGVAVSGSSITLN
jgi:uncharacterized protein involved in type VI secretion and phage assembly